MKKLLLFSMVLLISISFIACGDTDDNNIVGGTTPPPAGSDTIVPPPTGNDTVVPPPATTPEPLHKIDTANVDYNGVNQVVFYSLTNGQKHIRSREAWHIGIASGLYVVANSGNYGSGVAVNRTGETNFDLDFNNILTDTTVFSPTYTDNNPLGDTWMDLSSMPPRFTNEVYLVRIHDNTVYKVQFVSASMAGQVQMRIGELAEQNVEPVTFVLNNNYDMLRIDLRTRESVSHAPPKNEWDIKFLRTEFVMGTRTGGRSSVLLNTAASVRAGVVDSVNIEDVGSADGVELSADPFAIGHSWYTFDHATRIFHILLRTYVIQAGSGNYAKLQIHTFYGPNGEQFWSIFEYVYQRGGGATFSM